MQRERLNDHRVRRAGSGSMAGHQSPINLKDEWLTPPEILRALGPFDLDPCAPAKRPWDMAKRHYTLADNGLSQPWRGRVWLNPPYGAPELTGPWLFRMAEHGRGTMLIFARTETDLFFELVWQRATALLFLRGRLFFHHVDGSRAEHNCGAPSVLVAYGETDAAFLQQCGLDGHFMAAHCCKSYTRISEDFVIEAAECLPTTRTGHRLSLL